ncbi:hypothetical protein ACFE04_027775 [Oxalis oulophora]
MTRKRSTPKGVVEDVLCSDSSVKKWGFNIHIGGKVIHEPTLEYVGGESYDNEVSPKGFNLEVLEDIIEKSDSDVGRNDNVVVAVHEDEVVVHEEEVAVHDMPMAGHNVDNDVPQNDVSVSDGTDGSEENWSDVAGFDGATDGFDGSDVDDVSVDGISFCSDIEDEELVSLMTQANNLTETAATHGPEKDAIRQNRRVTNASNSDDEYEVGPEYMEDSNLNWSLTEDEDDVANINGEGEGDEEALAASIAAYYASIGKVPVQSSTGPSAPPIAEGVPVSTVPVVAVPTVPVEAPIVPVQATTVPVQATTTTVPDVPVVASFMRGPKLVKKRKAGDVLGQISKKPWK